VQLSATFLLVHRSLPQQARKVATTVILTFCVGILCALCAVPVRAQLYSGSLTGVVTDPSGGVVQNASVKLTDVDKGFEYTDHTDSVGRYLLRPLPPASYRLMVGAPGFQTYQQTGIKLEVNQNATINVTLRVGKINELVEVKDTAPLLDTQDATTGQEIDRKFINDLPLVSRQVLDLAFLAPGVNPAPTSPYSSGVANNFTSNGGRNMTADVLVDGASTTATDTNGTIQDVSYTPSVDAVQEFKIMQNNFSAEFGQSGNTVVNIVMRSGTNQFHGSAYEFLRNSTADANSWFNDFYDSPKIAHRRHNFGGTFGGPLIKDKLFFFVDYEGTREATQAGPFQYGVPSAAERTGDFGELCADYGGSFDATGTCSVAQGQLWDPYSGSYDPNLGGPVRTQIIPNNNLATYTSPGSSTLIGTPYQVRPGAGNLIDPVASKMMSYFPLPNLNVGNGNYNPYLNWTGSGLNTDGGDTFDIRIDRRFGDRTSLSGRFTYGWWHSDAAPCFESAGILDPCSGGNSSGGPKAFVLNSSHTFSATSVLILSFGYTRSFSGGKGAQSDPNFNLVSQLGFPSYMTVSGYHGPPQISIANYNSSLGANPWNFSHSGQDTYHWGGSVDKVRGRHELKFGGEFRWRLLNYVQPGPVNGQFGFDMGMTSQAPNIGSGDGMASFLMGLMDGSGAGQYHYGFGQGTRNITYAAYLQDNWRVTDKITLNLGMRYEVQVPRTERNNYLSWFDPNVLSPVQAPCVSVQVPGLPSQICPGTLHGGLEFAHPGDREMAHTSYSNWGPRAGLTYQFLPKTVMRVGYGIFYEPTYFAGTYGAYGTDGFDAWTFGVTTYQNDGATPFVPLSNPFPNGINAPPGSSLGLMTEVGQGVFAPIRSWNATPYMQTWSFGFERSLPGNTVVDVNYVGTKGTHLYYGGTWINHLGPWIETASPTTIAAMNSMIPNPFYGIITDPSSPISTPTIWAGTFFTVPSGYFPQFNFVSPTSPPKADSNYNALQLKVEKRLSQGLQFLGTYVFSKAIDDSSIGNGNASWAGGSTSLVNPNNLKSERSVSQFDIPQVLTLAYTYELPFGHGKYWGGNWNKWVNGFLGGWQTNGFWRIDNGQPIGVLWENYSNQPLPSYGQRPDLLAPLHRSHRSSAWFNVDPNACGGVGCGGFFSNPDAAAIAQPYTVGTAPRMLSNVRVPGNNNASLSVFKEFLVNSLREGTKFEFRFETFNAFNHPVFCGPNLGVASSQFGLVTSQCNSPRETQAGLKLYF
jgi:hypothetical protein